MEDDLDDFHGVVTNFLYLALGALNGLASLVLLLPDEAASQFELVLLEVVVEVAQERTAAFSELFVGFRLLEGSE